MQYPTCGIAQNVHSFSFPKQKSSVQSRSCRGVVEIFSLQYMSVPLHPFPPAPLQHPRHSPTVPIFADLPAPPRPAPFPRLARKRAGRPRGRSSSRMQAVVALSAVRCAVHEPDISGMIVCFPFLFSPPPFCACILGPGCGGVWTREGQRSSLPPRDCLRRLRSFKSNGRSFPDVFGF